MNKLVYTYTNLNCYSSICPHQFYRRYVKKDLKFVETPQMRYGTEVHAAMEQRIAGGKPLPEAMRQWESLVEPFARRGAKAEVKLAMTMDGRKTDFWGNPFLRGKVDCAVLNGAKRAYIADWKTGKVREDPFELQVGAMLLQAAYPTIKTIIGTYVWLKDGTVGETHDLSDTKATWDRCIEIAYAIIEDKVFEKREGPLCGYCPVGDCEFNRVRK